MDGARYTYFASKSRQRCVEVLEECFALDEVSPGEDPRIERGDTRDPRRRWLLTLAAD